MGDFSADRAIGAGFRLIGREPLAFLAWCLTYLVLGVGPQIGFVAAILPEWSRMAQEIASTAGAQTPMSSAEMFRAQAGMMQLQPLVWIASLVSHTVILSAIYRAVLEPSDRAFLYLRIGTRELWLGLTMLVLFVLAILLAIVVMAPAMILVGVLSALAHQAPGVQLAILPVMLLACGVIVWVLLRLSLATPMSFAQRGFRLYESWDLTRGQAGKMFLVALAFVVIAWLTEMILAGVGLALLGGFSSLERLSAWIRHPQFDLASLMPWILGGAVVATILSTAMHALFGAGWAEIYRELTEEPETA
jgi:hypothetical protein